MERVCLYHFPSAMVGLWGQGNSWALIYTQRNGLKAIAGNQEDSDYTRSLFGFSRNKKSISPMRLCNVFYLGQNEAC